MANEKLPAGKSSWAGRDHRGRRYVVDLEWSVVGGILTPTTVTLRSDSGVDTAMWRSVQLAAVADRSRATITELTEWHLDRPEISDADRKKVRRILAAGRAPKEDPDLLELVATTYRDAALKSRAPTKAVHEELVRRGHQLSRQQVGKLVMRCREVGLLGPARPGRPGETRRRKGAGK